MNIELSDEDRYFVIEALEIAASTYTEMIEEYTDLYEYDELRNLEATRNHFTALYHRLSAPSA